MPAPLRFPHWYAPAWYLAVPAVALYLCWRALRQPEYLRHWDERFLGRAPAPPDAPARARAAPRIWIHAVSVGETRAAQPLMAQLLAAHNQAQFVLTHMTPTGRAAGAQLARAFPGHVQQRYLPYDLPGAVRRFLRQTRPQVGVLMETEIWPQLLWQARARGLPVLLANARLSQRSLHKAMRQRTLMRAAASGIGLVGAQTSADRARIATLYDGPIEVTGNCKFDLLPDPSLLARGRALRAAMDTAWGARALWLFASTREGEERLILDALQRARGTLGKAGAPRILIVPRHPQRFDAVARLLQERHLPVLRRAAWGQALAGDPPEGATVLLGDSMGEMALYYAMADVALIGGSIRPLGGQNLIEACACACPVVLGPHMFNFAQAAADAQAAGAARSAFDVQEAVSIMRQISEGEATRQAMAGAALAFAGAHRGATDRTVALIERLLRKVSR